MMLLLNNTILAGVNNNFLEFLGLFNLQEKYPQKFTLKEALSISLEPPSVPHNLEQLPHLILQKIMMYSDYRRLCKEMSTIDESIQIHSIDSFIVLMHCCDDFLRQDMLSRLAACQIAIPVLLPNPMNKTTTFLLWSLRSIVLEWKCETDRTVVSKASRLVNHKGPIISFIRIGKTTSPKELSKSRILNGVIGDQKYFFNWNSEGGRFKRRFVDGLVELSYYLPSGNNNDSFSDCTLFLNLRGDACEHLKQLEFIKKVSFMSFLFLFEGNDDEVLSEVMDLVGLPGGLVIVLPDCKQAKQRSTALNLFKKATLFDMKDKNDHEITSEIQKIVRSKTVSADFLALSEFSLTAQSIGIQIDEDVKDNKKGCSLAKATMNKLQSVSVTEAKATLLPLQGPELWHKWAKHDKDSYRSSQTTDPNFEEIKAKIRNKQYSCASKLTPLMECFINGLVGQSVIVQKFFLQWLKLFLDDRTRETLPEMRAEHDKARNELQELKRGNDFDISQNLTELAESLKIRSKKLIEGSLGLEHFFRELGQIYEAKVAKKSRDCEIQCYPKIVVDILREGYPVELMDGDASHVPIIWVSAVLDLLAKTCRKKKIFVISVLGIQSSGKSTLLNTMFGLQFNVSAGRCTRGAFIQLMPVKKPSTGSKPNCDYVLIIDTEGLRAPELESDQSFKHDNELATFAIGLADVSIINIFGETPGDLNDIIQTAAHAFIRMKNIDLQLRCHFVHQNVSAVSGDKHAKFGHKKYQDRLDEMTRLAAVAENCEGKYYSFQDIIMFDEDTDVTYFPGLWKGDPPMASVSPGYSEKALQLKSALVSLVDTSQSDSNLVSFHLRVKKLWTAVCKENFIFSFKNTLEVTAYNELDEKFGRWSWMFHQGLLSWQHETGNSVSNCPPDQLSAVAAECMKTAETALNEIHDNVFKAMVQFFEKSQHSGTLVQWRARYEKRLLHLKEDRLKEAEKYCDFVKINREHHLKLEDLQKNYRQEILKQLTELSINARLTSKETMNDQQLEEKFNEKWYTWIDKLSSKEWTELYPPDETVEYEIGAVVQELLGKYKHILVSELKNRSLCTRGRQKLSIKLDQQKHINDCSTSPSSTGIIHKLAKFMHLSRENRFDIASTATNDFILSAKGIFTEIEKNFHNFNKSLVRSILITLIKNIESFNEENDNLFKPEYMVDMVLSFAGYLIIKFKKLMNEVRTTNNPVESLKQLRTIYLNIFLTQYKDIFHHVTAASNLCDILAIAIDTAVFEVLPSEIANSIKANSDDHCFDGKSFFKVKVLQDLAKRKNFQLYKAYLKDIKESFKWWAKEYVKSYCTENNGENLHRQAKNIVQRIMAEISSAVYNTDSSINIQSWLNSFHAKLSKILKINLSEIQDITKATHSEGCKVFVQSLTEELKTLEMKVMNKIEEPSSKFSQISAWNRSPQSLLCEHLYGCCAQCPFCGEQCELTDADHVSSGKDHYAKIHRPQCLNKYTWVRSRELVLDICTVSVESEAEFQNEDTNGECVAYKDYKTVYKDWCISNESPRESLKYWQWFVSKFYTEIIKWVNSAPTKIDHLGWAAVSEDDAIASLKNVQ